MPRRWQDLVFWLLTAVVVSSPSVADSPGTNGTPQAPPPASATPDKGLPADPIANLEANIVSKKTCDELELSPDETWLAATRTYSTPARGHIWDDSGNHSCLLIREVDDQDGTGTDLELGPDFFYWSVPPLIALTKIAWSPDSRFLLLVCSSAEGHQPWAFSVLVFDTKDNVLRNTDPLGTVVSEDLKFTDPNTVQLKTGEPSSPQPVDFDLGTHVAELPIVAKLTRESLAR